MKQSVYALLVGSAAAQPKYVYQGKESLILDDLVPQPKLIAATYDSVCDSADLKTANTNLATANTTLGTKKGDTVGNLAALQKTVATKLGEKNTEVDKVTAADAADRVTLLKSDDGNLKVLNLLKLKYTAEHLYSENLELSNPGASLLRVVLDSGTDKGKDPITLAAVGAAVTFKGTKKVADETAQLAVTAAAGVRGTTTSDAVNTSRYGSQNFAQAHLGRVDPTLTGASLIAGTNQKTNNQSMYSTNTAAAASPASKATVDYSETQILARADTAVQNAWAQYILDFQTGCQYSNLDTPTATTVTIDVFFGGAGTTVTGIKVTPAAAVVTLNSGKKMIDVATKPQCCVQDVSDANKCAVASTPYLGLLNKWEVSNSGAGQTSAAGDIGYGTGLKGGSNVNNLLTIDPAFLTTTNERSYRLSVYKTSAGGSLTRAKDTAMEEYYAQKRISDNWWLKRIRYTLDRMGVASFTTLANNILTYQPKMGAVSTDATYKNPLTMANKAGNKFGSTEVAVTGCSETATTDAGACKVAEDLFKQLGMKKYVDQTTASNMFVNNAWNAAGTGTELVIGTNGADTDAIDSKKRSIMDVFIYTKTLTNGVTAFTLGAGNEAVTLVDAYNYAKTWNALTGASNSAGGVDSGWRVKGKATFAAYKAYKAELLWLVGSKATTYVGGAGSTNLNKGCRVAHDNSVSKKSAYCTGVLVDGCADETACIAKCAKLPTILYAVDAVGTVTPGTIDKVNLVNVDNASLTTTSLKYCQGAMYDNTAKVCYMYSKGIQEEDAATLANAGKCWIRKTSLAIAFLTALEFSKKDATNDRWGPWYDVGMTAWAAKYAAFENANFLWQLEQESYTEDLAEYVKTSLGVLEAKTKLKYDVYHGAFNNNNGLSTRAGPTITLTVNTSSSCATPGLAGCLNGVAGGATTFVEASQNIYIPAVAITFPAGIGGVSATAKTVTPMINLADSGNLGGSAYGNWKRESDGIAAKRATWLDSMAMPPTYGMPSYGTVAATGGPQYVKWYALTNGYTMYKAAQAEYNAQSDIVLQVKADVAASVAVYDAAAAAASSSVVGKTAKDLQDLITARTTATSGLKAKMDAAVTAYKDYYMATSVGVYGTAGQGAPYLLTQAANAGGKTAVQLAVTINALRDTATGKWAALRTAEKAVTDFMETCKTAAGVAKPLPCTVGGYALAVNDVAAKTAIVKTEETKCKNAQWDKYKATLVGAIATRKGNMTKIKTLIDDEDSKRAALKAGATGTRCEKPTSNGDLKMRGKKPCTADTDCCGAATGKLVDTGAAAQVSTASNMATMTIEVCQAKTATKYKYQPPRMPMATTFPATVEWDFKCIGDARRIAAMATFAAASLFMMQ